MKLYIFTGDEKRDGMISAIAESFPSAETVFGTPRESSYTGSCIVTSLDVLESGLTLCRTEYAVVLYTDAAYLSSARHRDMCVEYGDKYTAVTLPPLLSELAALFESVITRKGETEEKRAELIYDKAERRLVYMGKQEKLSKLEAELYELFCRCGGEPLSREEIRRELWGEEGTSNAPDVYVSYLRRKLDRLMGEGSITNVRGVGYKMRH